MRKIFSLNFKRLGLGAIFSALTFVSCQTYLGVEKIDPDEQIKVTRHELQKTDLRNVAFVLVEEPAPKFSTFYADKITIELLNNKIQVIYYEAVLSKLLELNIDAQNIADPANLSRIAEAVPASHLAKISYKTDSIELEIFGLQSQKSVFKMELTGKNQVREGQSLFCQMFTNLLENPQYLQKRKKDKLKPQENTEQIKF